MVKLIFVFFFSASALASNCEIKLKNLGLYYTACPKGTLTDGVEVRFGNPPFATVIVRCVKPVIACEKYR